jgi:hypothetical protein
MDKQELAIFRVTEAWKETAIEAVMDIEGWRDAADRRDQYTGDPSREWPEMPRHFYGETATVAAWVTSCYPNLAPAPLLDVYEAVLAWYTDHNASRVPPQAVLTSTLHRAVLLINAIEYGIDIKHRYATEANPPETSGQAVTKPTSAARGGRATVAARMIDLLRDAKTHTWTARKFATKLDCSPSTVVDTPAWKQLRAAREVARQDRSKRAYHKNLSVQD